MIFSQRNRQGGGLTSLWLGPIIVLGLGSKSLAQITPDATLPSNSTVAPGCIQCVIDGGTTRGAHLFHSFREFSVPTGGQAWFNQAPSIQTILTRVTGGQRSSIDGLLKTNGTASLFFLNPNGIVFGPNAQIQVGGSFFASTASRFQFPDGTEFSATNPQAPPLLTVNLAPGLQPGTSLPEATIVNRGVLAAGQDLTLDATHLDLQGQLQAGRNLQLHAEQTVYVRDTVQTPFVAQAGGTLTVQGKTGIDILALNHPNQTPFQSGGNLRLVSDGLISGDARFASQQQFQVQSLSGQAVTLTSLYDPIISAAGAVEIGGNYNGAALLIESLQGVQINGSVEITRPDGAIAPIDADTTLLATSNAFIVRAGRDALAYAPTPLPTMIGDSTVQPGPATFQGIRITGNVGTNSGPIILDAATGNIQTAALTTIAATGGDITVSTRNGNITTGAIVPLGLSGRGGDVRLEAQSGDITVNGTINALSNGTGRGGAVTVSTGNGNIAVQGGINSFSIQGGANSDITVSATNGSITTPGTIVSSSRQRDGGAITYTATGNITVGRVTTNSERGNAGAIALTSQQGGITAMNDITATNDVVGNGGRIQLTAQGNIRVRRVSTQANNFGSASNGGNLTIRSEAGNVTATGELSTRTQSRGQAGDIRIEAPGGNVNVQLLRADSVNGRSGNVLIDAGQDIRTQNVEADTKNSAQNGGSVTFRSITGNIRSDRISTQSARGQRGGDIDLATQQGNINVGPLDTTGNNGSAGNMRLATQIGNITVRDTIRGVGYRGNGGNLTLETQQGDIRVNEDIVLLSTGNRAGNGGNIRIRTDQGQIALAKSVNTISQSGGNGGHIEIQAGDRLNVPDAGNITMGDVVSQANRRGRGGDITITTSNGDIRPRRGIFSYSNQGSGGNITLATTNGDIIMQPDQDIQSRGCFDLNPNCTGNGGNITVATGRGTIFLDKVFSYAANNGGDITVFSPQGAIVTRVVLAHSYQGGRGGDIRYTAGDGGIDASGVYSFSRGGRGGDMSFASTGNVRLANLNSTGDTSGNITINAGNIFEVSGTSRAYRPQGSTGAPARASTIISDTFGAGNGGNIDITAKVVRLVEGNQITASTHSSGAAGSITVRATERLEIADIVPKVIEPDSLVQGAITGIPEGTYLGGYIPSGKITDVKQRERRLVPSGLFSQSTSEASGSTGNIRVETPLLVLRNEGAIASTTFGAGPGGTTSIQAGNVQIQGGSILSGVAPGALGSSGTIQIQTPTLAIANGGVIQSQTLGQGNAGLIQVDADTITMTDPGSGIRSGSGDRLFRSGPIGAGADIRLNANQIHLTNGATLNAETYTNANGGNIAIASNHLVATQQGQVRTTTFGNGTAGSITLNLRDRLILSDPGTGLFANTATESRGSGGNLFATAPQAWIQAGAGIAVDTQGAGPGGTIQLQVGQLTMASQGFITAATTSTGNAGDIQVMGQNLLLTDPGTTIRSGSGTAQQRGAVTGTGGDIRLNVATLNVTNGATLSAETYTTGTGGNVFITGDRFAATRQGQIRTTALGSGTAGNIVVTLGDRLTLSDPGTGLFADTALGSTGAGGSILINAPVFDLQNGAGIAVDSQGAGQGGSIDLQTGRLTLRDRAYITAETATAQGGNITITTQYPLILRRNSLISATAGNAQAGGDGGNITITAPFVIGVLSENSDIRANAFTGRGGNVTINAQGIFGLQFQRQDTPFSDITASSRFGVSGTVTLNTLNVDPNRGLVAFPINLADPTNQIDQRCVARAGRASSFVATGRGGLPISPDQPGRTRIATPWLSLPSAGDRPAAQTVPPTADPPTATPPPTAEAQTWMQMADGSVQLVTLAPAEMTLSWPTAMECPTYE